MSEVRSAPALSSESTAGEAFGLSRKRFQDLVSPHSPSIVLNAEGAIQHLTPAARHLLEYKKDESIEPSFFSHIHSRNLYRIMRDVADMVCYGKTQATWLLRLRTGRGQWTWFRARARNVLVDAERAIIITLRDAHGH